MKPPKCRLCGHEHYGVDHVWGATNSVVNKDSNVVNRNEAVVNSVTHDQVDERAEHGAEVRVAVGRQTAWQQAHRERYNAKMREYMRRKRAG